ESALNMRDEEFRALVEHSSDLIVRFDTRQRLTFCNSAFLERYNLTWHNVSGKTCAGSGLPEKLARTWSDSLLEVMKTGAEKSIDLREKSSDGYDYFNVRFTPELDENGSVASVLTVARDISEYIRTETALRQTENRYHLIFNQSVDVLIHLGGNVRILDLNQRALDITGLRREEIIGKRISSLSGLFTKTSLARMVKAFSIRKMGIEVKPYEVEAKTSDGRRLFFEITGTPLIDDTGKNIGEIAVMRDITVSKKDHEQVIEKSRALSVRNQELTGLVEISTVIGDTLDIEELLERTLEKLTGMSILGIKPEGGIFLLEGDRLRLAAAKNVSETFRQQHLDLRIGQCLCGLAASEGEIVICTNNVKDARHTIAHDGMKPHGDIILPLKAFDRIGGVMFLYTESNIELGERKLELLRSIGSQLGMAINNALLFEEAREQSLHDPLTGLANRSLMHVELDKSLARCRRSDEPLSLLMLDLDFFKRFNDTYGHGAGDDLLVALARILEHEIREVDLIVRYGGEEFLVIMPDTSGDVAVMTADRIRQLVESTVFPAGNDRKAHITISIGAATSRDGSESKEILMVRADTALYLAKERGRNRVEQWVESHA
ncbi:MAG: sensor domain-containing diguanylate cyclase, partial [Thermoleophilia bacterium]